MAAENMGEREKVVRDVQVPEAITVQELANRMAEKNSCCCKSTYDKWNYGNAKSDDRC